MSKPDDRSDNARKLQEAKSNTLDNLNETNDYLDEHADEISATETSQLKRKNARRRQAVEGFEEEIADETEFAEEE
ncbi:small acid-soluble spore protein Tlp [Cohnella thailandensis]|jgi:small, acid-soluble spore protein tlp|uniref:Small acid-soluble spore protein Tlp n=1 Tax=Cohnella thailandensis TaxID=557557 RepID=A0A841T1R4_9BACL|nr:small acid-soluble spore protein Tlp [Cohnella thailandensis]MBB6638343.1 small acid-soluble spore protein Tlp [Cohnella thailandensis]MBP1977179.1 small acid-soluble spore protein (thioredoxin-like protein) [Cohnella thailandensis]